MLTINKNLIENTLVKAASFTEPKDLNANCVFITADNNELFMEATNYQESIRIKNVPCTTKTSIERTAVDGKRLLSVIKAMKNEDITMQVQDNELIVKQGRTRFKLAIMSENSINSISFTKGETKISLKSSLIEGFQRINHAIDPNFPKFELSGALIEITKGAIALVGTDTKRLAGVKYEYESEESRSLIVSKQCITSMERLFEGVDIDAYVDDVCMTVETQTLDYSTRLVNGKYPEWKRIVPKQVSHQIQLNSDVLQELVQQARIIDDYGLLKISKNELTLIAQDGKGSYLEASTEFDSGVDEDVEIGFTLRHLNDFLTATDERDINLLFNDSNSPFMMQTESLIEVLMPVQNLSASNNETEKDAA